MANIESAFTREDNLTEVAQRVRARLEVWNPATLTWDRMTQPSGGAGGGGGAITVADGADATQGATTDAAYASGSGTIVSILKGIFSKVAATLNVSIQNATLAVTQSGAWTFARSWTLSSATDSVNVGNFPATQPVSLATNTPDVIDRAARLLGHVTVDNASIPVTGTFFQGTQPVSGTVTAAQGAANATPWNDNLAQVGGAAVSLGAKVSASSVPVVVASDQAAIPTTKVAAAGQANVLKTGTLTTTAVTADQVVLTYTVTALKTFYLCYLVMYGRLTAVSAVAVSLGAISMETPSGTKTITLDDMNPTTSEVEFNPIVFGEPIPIAAGAVIRVVVTPAATTSTLWRANFGGYEK